MNVQSSASLKRLNHLQCEMSVVYHEMSHLCGLSDSTMQILYTICNFDEESCLLRDICRLTGIQNGPLPSFCFPCGRCALAVPSRRFICWGWGSWPSGSVSAWMC